MKSDRQAIGATQDAMAIGAAKADTAYAATDSIVDVLSQFKSRLVAATEDGVDKTKIQSVLAQLNAQAESMVRSASFNGVNWLKTDSPTHIQDLSVLTDRVVSGFVRDANNNVSVQTNEVDLRRTSMLNTGGGGILQKDVLDYYMPLGGMTNNTDHHYAHEDHTFNGPVTFDVSDFVDFNLVVDRSDMAAGDTFAVSVDKSVIDSALGATDGIIKDAKDLRAVLQKAFDNAGASTAAGIMNTYTTSTTRFEIRSLETTGNIGSSVYVEDLDSSFNASSPSKFLGLDSTPSLNHDNMFPSSSMSFIQPFKTMLDTKIDFDLSIDGSTLQTYTIDRDAVDAALGTTDGRINSADDLKTIVQYVTGNVGLAINVSGNQMVYSADQADYPGYGTNAVDFYMSSFRPDPPFTLRFDLAEVDVTDDTFSVDEYIQGRAHVTGCDKEREHDWLCSDTN
jgi:flagellin